MRIKGESGKLKTETCGQRIPVFLRFPFSAFSFHISALIGLLFLWSGVVSGQLTPLNFVYTGSGGQTDALKFTYEGGFFKKHGIDATMTRRRTWTASGMRGTPSPS
ncbi:MAG: hypothetical protein ACREP8_10160, partial [Candidatus Binatia bacterium]